MTDITIFHNPSCTTSRNTLALLRHAGLAPRVVEYLKTPLTKPALRGLLAELGIGVRDLLREKGTPFAELGLADPKWTDDQLLDAMVKAPILMERPIVTTPLGSKICRPTEEVLELLPVGPIATFTKEDGSTVQDSGARRGSQAQPAA